MTRCSRVRFALPSPVQPSASVADGLSSFSGAQSQLTSLLGTTFGQGLTQLTKGAPQEHMVWEFCMGHALFFMAMPLDMGTAPSACCVRGVCNSVSKQVLHNARGPCWVLQA